MSYSGKTNWQFDEVVKEADLNRIEQGLLDAHAGVETAKSEAKAYTDEKVAGVTPGAIGAVKKSDFDAHTADAGLHVTAAKQAAWDAKETTAGSQAKADAAKTAAAADATTKANAAQAAAIATSKTASMQAKGYAPPDLNNATEIGVYQLVAAASYQNGPPIDWCILSVEATMGGYIRQIASPVVYGTPYVRTRTEQSTAAAWTPWKRLLTQDDVITRVNSKGQLEYFTGGAWKSVGGGAMKVSNTIQEQGSANLRVSDNEQKLWHVFYPPSAGTFRIFATGNRNSVNAYCALVVTAPDFGSSPQQVGDTRLALRIPLGAIVDSLPMAGMRTMHTQSWNGGGVPNIAVQYSFDFYIDWPVPIFILARSNQSGGFTTFTDLKICFDMV